MFKKFFIRDRMIMAGLILLGLFTVAAGFVSGRSTFQYALSTDARQASAAWVEKVENEIRAQQAGAGGQIAGQKFVVDAPGLLSDLRKMPPEMGRSRVAIGRPASQETGLLAGIDALFAGWISGLTELLDADSHVSRVRNFALLDPTGRPVLRNAEFDPSVLGAILRDNGFRADFHKALGTYSTRIAAAPDLPDHEQDEFHKLLLVPVMTGPAISHIYALEVDQSSAATMSKVALVAASMMTCLLIVLGYSVPAAVAFRRIRERWKAEDQIRFLAMHDPLTGLPNRVQMQNRLDQALARARRHGKLMAVMCLDLDRFKDVNDTLGHQTGDALLREVAKRLRTCIRETDVVARFGGDEFAIIAEDLEQPNDAIPVARRICECLARTFEVNGHSLSSSGSVGITFAPSGEEDSDVLLNNADLALYRAKHDGRNTFRFFEPEMDRAVQERRLLSNELRCALRNNELGIHYQPQFDLQSGELTGYEALARWRHAERGDIPPDEFIPIAEENGLIGFLGEWVLRTACQYASDWPASTSLAVNISPAQFYAQDIVGMVDRVLRETGFPANRLQLEITENVLLRNTEETIETLKQLAGRGVSLALDDFGTGYSSLSYLTRFPVSKIKIDQSFVEKMGDDRETNAIVSTIVGLGRSLDVTITAEGVETTEQAEHLRALGCNEVQGFLFGRPKPDILGGSPQQQPASAPAVAAAAPVSQPAVPAAQRSSAHVLSGGAGVRPESQVANPVPSPLPAAASADTDSGAEPQPAAAEQALPVPEMKAV